MGTLNTICQIAEFVYGAQREFGTMPRTQDVNELQHMADHQDVWDRLS